MEQEKVHFVHKEDFIFAGAIFMSNRATKLECLKRKLFGLPQSKAKFMEQVKIGMILFLFEHEERKLYGVFEATSDGALNIIPDAFRSTGQSYPAQICCKRILMCRPLCEDEFRSAIQDNYYSPNKFHFGLSYDQVTNLIHLFYSKKINLKQHQKPLIPDKIITRPENSAAENVRLTEVRSYAMCESDECSGEGNWELRRECTLPQSSMNLPMPYAATDTGRESNQLNLHALEPQPSLSQDFYSEPVDSSRSSLFVPIDRAPFSHFSTGKQFSTTEDMYHNKPLPQESDQYMTKFDSVAVPFSMGQHHYSRPDVTACMLSCDNMTPRQIKIQEPHVFETFRAVNDGHHQTAVLHHTSVYGPQTNQLFEFPDYIPLPEDLQQGFLEKENHNSGGRNFEYVSSAAFRSCIPSSGKEISEAFNVDDDKELKIYPRLVSDDYPAVSRASVFSRLSRGQNVNDAKTPESPTNLPLDQLLNILDSRRERWSTPEASKQSGKRSGGDQYDRTVSTKFFNQSSGWQDKFAVQPVEQITSNQHEHIAEAKSTSLDYDQVVELSEKGSFDLPFYNFRRRNMSQKFEVRDDLNTGSKRRRILRPSLYGEEQNAKGKAEVETLTATISEGEKENRANCLKSELEGESVSSFVGPETELKTDSNDFRPESDSKVSGFQTHQKSELEVESVSSFVLPETELMTPTQVISDHETKIKVTVFQTHPKSELAVESLSSFGSPETELNKSTQVVSENETESKVPDFQTRQKSKMECESVQANAVRSVLESEDYIPLD